MDQYKKETAYELLRQVIGLHYCRSQKLLEEQGVYPGQPPLLFALHKEDGQSHKQLAEALSIQPATVTMMVKRMAKAGLIERKQDQQDQRVYRVYLTQEGERIRKKVALTMQDIENDCFGTLSKEEKETLYQLLAKMRDSLLDKEEVTYG